MFVSLSNGSVFETDNVIAITIAEKRSYLNDPLFGRLEDKDSFNIIYNNGVIVNMLGDRALMLEASTKIRPEIIEKLKEPKTIFKSCTGREIALNLVRAIGPIGYSSFGNGYTYLVTYISGDRLYIKSKDENLLTQDQKDLHKALETYSLKTSKSKEG